jgi:diguanylate cyclase
LKITVSIGCATYSPMLKSVNQIIEAADTALYQAKHLGRNRICVAAKPEGDN